MDTSVITTMRVSVPPVRYSNPEYVVPARRVVLNPFQGQPRKYRGVHRLPKLVIKGSGIRDSGLGLFLGEKVRAGQIITLFRRNRISESRAKMQKNEVSNLLFALLYHCGLIFLYFHRATGTFESIELPAAVWTLSQQSRLESNNCGACMKLLEWPTRLRTPMENLMMSGLIRFFWPNLTWTREPRCSQSTHGEQQHATNVRWSAIGVDMTAPG